MRRPAAFVIYLVGVLLALGGQPSAAPSSDGAEAASSASSPSTPAADQTTGERPPSTLIAVPVM